jgi:hypothetical protein
MRKFLVALLILFSVSTLCAAPPVIIVGPTGDTTIKTASATILLKIDGSVTIKGPAIDLLLPGAAPKPDDPKPDDANPDKPDPLIERIGTLYGSLADPGKAEKTQNLSQMWRKAILLADSCDTLGDLNTKIKSMQALKEADLLPIREAIRDELARELGTSTRTPLDKPKARTLFDRIATALDKAVSE